VATSSAKSAKAPAVVELLGRTHETEHPLLDQVKERQALVSVVLRDRDDEAQVGSATHPAPRLWRTRARHIARGLDHPLQHHIEIKIAQNPLGDARHPTHPRKDDSFVLTHGVVITPTAGDASDQPVSFLSAGAQLPDTLTRGFERASDLIQSLRRTAFKAVAQLQQRSTAPRASERGVAVLGCNSAWRPPGCVRGIC
jgi:hypothetical protein